MTAGCQARESTSSSSFYTLHQTPVAYKRISIQDRHDSQTVYLLLYNIFLNRAANSVKQIYNLALSLYPFEALSLLEVIIIMLSCT